MKKICILLIILAAVQSAGCKTIEITVVDDLGFPIENAEVSVWFKSILRVPEDKKTYKSDENGRVLAKGDSMIGFDIKVEKEGHYLIRSEPNVSPHEYTKREFVLRSIINPIPLYVKRGDLNGHFFKVPIENEWVGFDFKKGDWMEPYGSGEVADIQFKYHHEFKGYTSQGDQLEHSREIAKKHAERRKKDFSEEEYKISAGKWDGTLEISFSNPLEGGHQETKKYLPQSYLRLPNQAPEDGYIPEWKYSKSSYIPGEIPEEVGYFLRTRVVLDDAGNIISANYTKIYGEIKFNPRSGTIQFMYFYNPTPNDRNLESNGDNLFTEGTPGIRIKIP